MESVLLERVGRDTVSPVSLTDALVDLDTAEPAPDTAVVFNEAVDETVLAGATDAFALKYNILKICQ